MSSSPLEQLIAFNDQLAALIEAGVPMETGLSAGPGQIQSQLQEINANVARQVSQGASVDEALAGAPPLYRSLVRTGLSTGDLELALRASNRLAQSGAVVVQTAVFSLVYPAIILLLVYAGIVFFCLWLVPTLEEIYASAGVAPRSALSVLAFLRTSLPYWVALPPVCLAAVAMSGRGAIKRSSARSAAGRGWLPGLWRARYEASAANFAHLLAALLESGVPFSEAIFMAGDAWGPGERESAAHPPGHGSPAAEGDQPFAGPPPNLLPPLLKWAIYGAESKLSRPAALRIAADTYRSSAQRRLERWRLAAPAILCIVVGGGATLLYGLALFLPIVDLLEGLAQP